MVTCTLVYTAFKNSDIHQAANQIILPIRDQCYALLEYIDKILLPATFNLEHVGERFMIFGINLSIYKETNNKKN